MNKAYSLIALCNLLRLGWTQPVSSQSITWNEPCTVDGVEPFESELPLECGNLTVPLDYKHPESNETATLQLLRVPAKNQPSKGSILFNFGGPGFESRTALATQAKNIHAVLNDSFDLIAADPRGTANTLTFSCFDTVSERNSFLKSTSLDGSMDVSDRQGLGRMWAAGALYAEACQKHPQAQRVGRFVNTAYTARDLIQIVDALNEDGLLRFWGTSYGTLLGTTVASLFPDRIDRMVLDSVLNPREYYFGFDESLLTDADASVAAFFEECVKAPELCELASDGATAASLVGDFYELLDELKFNPIPLGGQIIDDNLLVLTMRPILYGPSQWPILGSTLDALFSKNATKLAVVWPELAGSAGSITSTPADDSAFGIACVDKQPKLDSLEEALPYFAASEARTAFIGARVDSQLLPGCSHWPFEAAEIPETDFSQPIATRNPVLVAGNTFDVATPLRSSYNLTVSLQDSVVLEHGVIGHGIMPVASLCTALALRSYFVEGTLPASGTKCEADFGPFEGKSWEALYEDLGYEPAV